MHVRINRVARGSRTYEYTQLVQSFRRPSDGKSTVRVVANLGELTALERDNLRKALDASRRGAQLVVLSERDTTTVKRDGIFANRRYLDVAVLLEQWRGWGLDEILADLLPVGDAVVPPADVVAALTLQRCVAPKSKLKAVEWFPTTALPELLGVAPPQFNNTRLHRVLEDLDGATDALMRRLPERYLAREGAFAALFADVTDTWFEGAGCELAQPGKTKEGLYRQKFGVVLLCTRAGYPLRWKVVPGRQNDGRSLSELFANIAGLSWTRDVPVICDRAMGKTAYLRDLQASTLRFLTALTSTEFDAYSDRLPGEAFADLPLGLSEETRRADVARAREAIERTGFEKVDDTLFFLDLGLVEHREALAQAPVQLSGPDKTLAALRIASELREQLDAGARSYAAAGRPYGFDKSRVASYLRLLQLPQDVRTAVAEGHARGLSIKDLLRLSRLPTAEDQRTQFRELAQQVAVRRDPRRERGATPSAANPDQREEIAPLWVRGVLYFNPEMFVEQRATASRHVAEVAAEVDDLNRRLANPRSSLTPRSAFAALDHLLRKRELLEAYDVRLDGEGDGSPQPPRIEANLRPAVWRARRRYDGFSMLVADPQIRLPAAELCGLYRAKDTIEKDFSVIKGLIKLRPVRHRTDPKVRAHVTLCMLALLLERSLTHALKKSDAPVRTAQAALELLATCHLNEYDNDGRASSAYTVTRPSPVQLQILRALEQTPLVDTEAVAARITPR